MFRVLFMIWKGSVGMRNRALKWILLCASLLLLGAFFVSGVRREQTADLNYLDQTSLLALTATLQESKHSLADGETLLIEGYPAPYDAKTNCFTVPQSLKTDGIDGNLSWSNAQQTATLGLTQDFRGKADALKGGTSYPLLIQQGDSYTMCSVLFSGMPAVVMLMDTDNSIFGPDNRAIAEVRVFQPGDGNEPYTVYSAEAKVSLRGTSSINYDKKSYNVTLYDGQGLRSKLPLLGMPNSDQWILKSLLMDPMRMREYVTSTLWNNICSSSDADLQTSEFRYAELFLDDSYDGLFGLMRKIDIESEYTLDADKDVYFKANTFDFLRHLDPEFVEPAFLESGIQFPEVWRDGLYDPIYWYVDAMYLDNSTSSYEEILSRLNLPNIADYSLFFMLVTARDNYYTNTIYVFRGNGDSFETTLIPWDMDMTLGNSWNNVWEGGPISLAKTQEVYLPREIETLTRYDSEGTHALLSARWKELRKSVLTDEALRSLVVDAFSQMENSGAIARETTRWPGPPVELDQSYMLDYFQMRAAFMDQYFS